MAIRILQVSSDLSGEKQFKELSGKDAPLAEVCFDISIPGPKKGQIKRRFRLPAMFRPTQQELILFGGSEKDHWSNYTPSDAFTKAKKYLEDLEADIGGLIDHEIL